MAELQTGRDKVLSAYRSHHANTGAEVVATGEAAASRANIHAATGSSLPLPLPHRVLGDHTRTGTRTCAAPPWAHDPERGLSSIAAVLLESIPGTTAILIRPPGYLAGCGLSATDTAFC